ncbi:MAG: transposase [Cyclobacteriaceae bacterium]
MLVPAGGPDPDHMEWVAANKKFFVPVKALAGIFRGVFMEKLRNALAGKVLRLPEKQMERFTDGKLLNKAAYEKTWHIHIKETFRGAGQVLAYLGRYLPSGRRAPTGLPSATAGYWAQMERP